MELVTTAARPPSPAAYILLSTSMKRNRTINTGTNTYKIIAASPEVPHTCCFPYTELDNPTTTIHDINAIKDVIAVGSPPYTFIIRSKSVRKKNADALVTSGHF